MNVFMYTPKADATASEHAGFADRLVGVWSLITYTEIEFNLPS
jgi:hypothetical protein